ncbi:MAG: solute carrier family 23 protein [Thermodesulforhabdaceae bacterium]
MKNLNVYIYDLDDKPPLVLAILYGVQWALFLFPAIPMVTALCAEAFKMDAVARVAFVQLTFLVAGSFTLIQSLWGHRYPLLEGPATAHLLTVLSLAPQGIGNIQAGMILGSIVMFSLGLLGNISFFSRIFTRNIVVVILMLIAFSITPHLTASLVGYGSPQNKAPQWLFFAFSSAVVIFTAFCSYHLKGIWKTLSLLIGVIAGTLFYPLIGSLDFTIWKQASWISIPTLWTPIAPKFSLISSVSFAIAYLAVLVNALGSLAGIASITDNKRLNSSLKRSLTINGLSGIVCGLLGIVGLVSYSMSPGVVTAQRVASRYTLAVCGVVTIMISLVPKIAATFAFVPSAVVSAVLCVAMGSQVGAALQMVTSSTLTQRDGTVIGLSVLLGLIVSILPPGLTASAHPVAQLFLKNGLISGIFLSLILEHGLLRDKSKVEK